MKSFDELFIDITKYGTKIQTSEYKDTGKNIIIDQGQAQIAGYTDRNEGVLNEVPAIIFGDHTRVIKYIDQPFFLGADGIKVLQCKDNNANYKYLYYALKNAHIPDTGYNRHFKWLKEVQIHYPTRDRQDKIVEILDETSEIIQKRRDELENLDNLIKARFVELFVGKKYEIVKAGSIIKEMRNGVSPSTSGNYHEKVLTLSAITQGKFDDKAWKDGLFIDCPSDEKRIKEDDFYMCRGNGNKSLVGMGVYTLENRPDLIFPDTVIAARIDTERMILPYLWVMWQQPEIRKQIESGARTTNGTYKINQKVISEIKVICPPINVQIKFAHFVNQVNKSKVAVQDTKFSYANEI